MFSDIVNEIVKFYEVPNVKQFKSQIPTIFQDFFNTKFKFEFDNNCKFIESENRIYLHYNDLNVEIPKIYLYQTEICGKKKMVALTPFHKFMSSSVDETMQDIAIITIYMSSSEFLNNNDFDSRKFFLSAPILYLEIINILFQGLDRYLDKEVIKQGFDNGRKKIKNRIPVLSDINEDITNTEMCNEVFDYFEEYKSKRSDAGFSYLYLDYNYINIRNNQVLVEI